MFKKISIFIGSGFLGMIFCFGLTLLVLGFKNGVSFRAEARNIGQESAHKLVGFIYDEATIHNPKGDILPDWIDDFLKSEIKKLI